MKMKKIIALLFVLILSVSFMACKSNEDNNETTATTTTTTKAETQGEELNLEETEDLKLTLHYLRSDGNYDGWNLWIWMEGKDGAAYPFDASNVGDKGASTTIEVPAAASNVGFIVRLNEWESKDPDGDRFIDVSEIVTGTVDVYLTSGESDFEIVLGEDAVKGTKIIKAMLSGDLLNVSIDVTQEITNDPKESIALYNQSNQKVELSDITFDGKKGTLILAEPADAFGSYFIVLDSKFKYNVTTPDIFSTESFEAENTYTGDDLGANWSKDKTMFRVWSPTAVSVKLNLYETGDINNSDLIETLDMEKDVNGTWIVEKSGDLNGTYYTYTVNANNEENEACDPYARTTGVNGNRAMVIDLASTNPDGWDKDVNPNKGQNITDAIIYELHVRDLSSDPSSGIKNVGKYLGLLETGTRNDNGDLTGLDYMKDLGINYLHLLPVYDYQTVDESKLDIGQFNWGYDPKNYNTPEGSYSSDPFNGEVRVKEFKQMVQGLHDNGISVIMDVVYNHTYNSDYCFNKIVPNYFYRIDGSGKFSNGSGCGNDVASERSMVSKFIVDSVVYWAKEYHIDGFRFDLVGLTDVDTINTIRAELDKIDPSIIMYGEGWSLETALSKNNVDLAVQANADKMPGMALFSDNIRDSIKGSVFDGADKGYVNDGAFSRVTEIKNGVLGLPEWSPSPTSVINYTSCHDNLSLWDKINSSNAEDSLEDRIKQNLLAAAIVYTAQGTPFMQAGEEILRSKPREDGTFDHNSYASPDSINSIKWNTFSDPTYKTVYDYYKGLIAFRKAHASLRMTENTKENITFAKGLPDGVIAYTINKVNQEISDGIFIVYNPLREDVTVTLPEGEWNVCVKGDKAGTDIIETVSGDINVESITCMVLVKGAVK